MANKYPLPSYHFIVKIGDDESENVAFSEVSGLKVETQSISYREGSNKEYLEYKMPGHKKYEKIVLKRGTMADNNLFYEWINKNNLNTTERKDITISLLNEEHEAVVTWNVKNAFPVSVDFGSLNANEDKVLIESISLEHEGLTVTRK